MTVTQDNRTTFRIGLVALLGAAWLYSMVQWLQHTNGAAVTLGALLGLALLGVAAWVAPIASRGLRISVRIVGTAVGVLALSAFTLLIVMLRNGL